MAAVRRSLLLAPALALSHSDLHFPRLPKMTATKEVINLSTVLPFVQRWQAAIARRDVGASVQAGQDYQAAWQAVEVYLNHRSLPLYTDIEPDTSS